MPQITWVLQDPRFLQQLQHFDDDLAGRVRSAGCPCGGRLHGARYPRKPRGGPATGLPAGYGHRASFCCAEDGCRRRATPPSFRFLGRKVYLAVVVVLISALSQRVTVRRFAQIRAHVGVCRRTLERWREWWLEVFAEGRFWQEAKARFAPPPPSTDRLPASLIERFAGDDPARLLSTLRFLLPITTASAVVPAF